VINALPIPIMVRVGKPFSTCGLGLLKSADAVFSSVVFSTASVRALAGFQMTPLSFLKVFLH